MNATMKCLIPAARETLATMNVNNPVVPSHSYHCMMMVDCGRVPAVTRAMVEGQQAPPAQYDLAVSMVQHQRQFVPFVGLKRWAGLGLFLPHPSGMDDQVAAQYLTSAAARHDLARIITLVKRASASVHGVTHRWKLRMDTEIDLVPADGSYDLGEYVLMNADELVHVPYIYQQPGDPRTIGNAASVAAYVTHYLNDLTDAIDTWTAADGSDKVLNRLVGVTVWATPCCVAHAGGERDVRRGEIPLNPSAFDKLCIARAIVTALDDMIYARTSCSIVSLCEDALDGALVDTSNAEKRLAAAVVGSLMYLKRFGELRAAKDRVVSSTAELVRAKQSFEATGRTVLDRTSSQSTERARPVRRYATIELALKQALAGRGEIDLSHPFFQAEQVIDIDSVAFINKTLAPHVKAQFWVRNAENSIALSHPADGADLAFLVKGGRIINLYCDEGHVTVIGSVNTLCVSLSHTNQRVFCELCGISVSHTGSSSLFHSKTVLATHRAAGCPLRGGAVMTQPMSQDNIRQLNMRDFVAKWPLAVHAALVMSPEGQCAVTLSVSTPTGSRRVGPDTRVAWTRFLSRFSARDNATREGDLSLVRDGIPCESYEHYEGSLDAVVDSLFSPEHTSFLIELAIARYYRCTVASDVLRATFDPTTTRCVFCDTLVAGPSRFTMQVAMRGGVGTDEEDDDEEGVPMYTPLPGAVDTHVLCTCPSTGRPSWAHSTCAEVVARRYTIDAELIVDVGSVGAMSQLTACLLRPTFIETVCGGVIPSVYRNGNFIRGLRFRMHSAQTESKKRKFDKLDNRGLVVKFRGPDVAGVSLPVQTSGTSPSVSSAALSLACDAASERSLAANGLNVLYFDTEISYARTSLYASVPSHVRPVTSVVSRSALTSYGLLAKGGRILTGCAVLHAPLVRPTDRTTARLILDFTAAYPSVAMNWPLPHEGHLDTTLHDFSSDLPAGEAYIAAAMPADSTQFICRVVVSGHFHASLHSALRQFPPLFSRMVVPVASFSAFQRGRLGSVLHADKLRTVSHLLPIVRETLFVREAQILARLGFTFTYVGEVNGCPASFWARDFMLQGEHRRRTAASDQVTADVKRIYNSVVGSTNINMGRHPALKSVWSNDVVPEDGFKTGAAGLGVDDPRKDRRTTRLSDDPRFTGRVYATDHVTMIERFPDKWKHKMQPEWALAVQAYARCDQLELWYGSVVAPGILSCFPDAKLIYGNTDSIVVELALSTTHIAAGFSDVRTVLYNTLQSRMDISNVPLSSTFWSSFRSDADLAAAKIAASSNAGRWGFVKEETGMAGYEAVVVNGPNRWGARVVQSDTDTLPKHVQRRDILKMLPKAWTATSLEQYAVSWSGGHTSDEIRTLVDLAPAGIAVPVEGTCIWGNTACVVNEDGEQWPFGAALVQCPV